MTTFLPVAGAGGLENLLAGLVGGTGMAGAAAPGGLQGLFGSLVGGEAGMDAAALMAALGGMQAGVTGEGVEMQSLLPLMQNLDLGNGLQLELQGAGVDIAFLQQTITEMTVTLQTAGIDFDKLGNAGELAQALIVQGMDPEEAVAKAAALESMLKLLKEKLSLKDGEETAGLAVLLLAGAMQPLPIQQAVTVTLRHETQTVQMVNVSLLTSTKTQGAYKDSGDVLSRLLAGKVADEKPAEAFLTAEETAPDVQAVTQAVTTAAMPAVEVKPQPEKVVDVNAQANLAVQVATAAPRRIGTEVAREEVLEPIDGETMFKMKEGRDGALTVEATPAAGKALEQHLSTVTTGEPVVVRHAAKEGAGVPVHSAWPFADQVAAAAKARVSEQAVVQIKALVDGGGGTVRMILNPPELGEVRIELVIKHGEVTGTLAANDVAVVHELSRDLTGLKQAFADAGLKLGQDGLNVALSNQQHQQFGQGQQGQEARQAHGHNGGHGGAAGDGTEAATVETATAARWVRPDSLVDVEI